MWYRKTEMMRFITQLVEKPNIPGRVERGYLVGNFV
jgi:hypothetical protein